MSAETEFLLICMCIWKVDMFIWEVDMKLCTGIWEVDKNVYMGI